MFRVRMEGQNSERERGGKNMLPHQLACIYMHAQHELSS